MFKTLRSLRMRRRKYTPAEARKLWVAALRSGKYRQTRSALCRVDEDGGRSYCCLGVPCDLYQKYVGGLEERQNDGCVSYDGNQSILPIKVVQWLGLNDRGGDLLGKHNSAASLWLLNDFKGMSLSEIADVIESEPEGLCRD